MTFEEILDQAIAMLQRRGRVTYRLLQRQFQLDDDTLRDLRAELRYAHGAVISEDEQGMVWTGGAAVLPTPPPAVSQPFQPSVSQEAPAPQADGTPTTPSTPDAERRQLTVMFCDLVDSTKLSSQLDPEDWRDVVRAYQRACSEIIQRYEGHVAQLLGDGLLVYFGYPQAHEDDAQRAVHTGLGILDAMGDLNKRLQQTRGLQLAVRVGIHTGLVVVGEMGGAGRQEQLALGEVPNVCSRIQGLAASDTVAISEATYRLVQGYFECQDLGAQTLRGVSQPLKVYRVLGDSGAQGRLDITSARELTPLVGREQEVSLLLERWAQVKDGHGQVVLLTGDAGIGKSRLVQMLKEHVAHEPHTRWECRSAEYSQNTALFPLVDLFQRILQFDAHETPDAKLEKLEHALSQSRLPLEESVPLFAPLLSLHMPENHYPPLNISPQRQRQKILETIVALLLELAAQQPVLFILEDLHWVDPSTLEVLNLLIEQTPTASLLVLLTCRPHFQPPWHHRSYITEMTLPYLSHAQVEQIVTGVTDGKTLPKEVIQQIIAKTDGVPLFVEEITKAILESGYLKDVDGQYALAGTLPSFAIPTTLQDSLMARLDRLVSAKGIAQLGAVIGREFSYEWLEAVSQLDTTTLQRELGRLIDAELLSQRDLPPQATYMFKHALIRDAAYESLLKSTRQQYHQRIAQVLEAQFPETVGGQPELLAHHYTEAGLIEQALGYLQKAGQSAAQRSAHVEAISHLCQGLELLQTLPETLERAQQEFPLLMGLWHLYFSQAQIERARELAAQCFTLAQRLQDVRLLQEAHMALGSTLLHLGEYVAARASLEQGIALYDPQQCRILAFSWRTDSGVICLVRLAWTLWMLGYVEQALERSREALALAQDMSHAYSLAFALHFAALIHQCRREVQAVQELAEAEMALANAQGFPYYSEGSMIRRGWVLVQQGAMEEGLAQLQQGLDGWLARGYNLGTTHVLARLAEAYGKAGQAEKGLRVLAEALTAMHKMGERQDEGELYRLKGVLLLAVSSEKPAEAEACFQQALDVTRRQEAKSLELRAAMSLARLWQQQGKRAAAYDLLAPVYGWFTEGFDTLDLQEAKALLDALA